MSENATGGSGRTVPLCEHKAIWEMAGWSVTEYTECANDAVGRFEYIDQIGQEGDFDLCEDHTPDDAELIERYSDTDSPREASDR